MLTAHVSIAASFNLDFRVCVKISLPISNDCCKKWTLPPTTSNNSITTTLPYFFYVHIITRGLTTATKTTTTTRGLCGAEWMELKCTEKIDKIRERLLLLLHTELKWIILVGFFHSLLRSRQRPVINRREGTDKKEWEYVPSSPIYYNLHRVEFPSSPRQRRRLT